ncbi:uncharacterized protein VTP21DRAFT_3535 [Calcarisporiella thermophila]|uniref:uncharacterized protein n=1 Tax=Calcarisporiella thermophila TaxID=911321 RepID=UPI0037444CB7
MVDQTHSDPPSPQSNSTHKPSVPRTSPSPPPQSSDDRRVRHEVGKLFIGGLSWESTNESLAEYFSKFGQVKDCVVMHDSAGRSRGFGFVTFADPEVLEIVLQQEHVLDGKKVDPKRAIPREEQDRTEKIFVGGVAPTVSEEEFRDYFSRFGNVLDATLMTSRQSGKSRGFGFVVFESGQSVEEVLRRTDLELHDKRVEVKRAMPKHKSRRPMPPNMMMPAMYYPPTGRIYPPSTATLYPLPPATEMRYPAGAYMRAGGENFPPPTAYAAYTDSYGRPVMDPSAAAMYYRYPPLPAGAAVGAGGAWRAEGGYSSANTLGEGKIEGFTYPPPSSLPRPSG